MVYFSLKNYKHFSSIEVVIKKKELN